MANKLKAGIIGCGGIANGKHMPSIKALGETELVAFCDLIIERAEKAKAQYGTEDAQVFTDYKELLEKEDVQSKENRCKAKRLVCKTVRNLRQMPSPAMEVEAEQSLIRTTPAKSCTHCERRSAGGEGPDTGSADSVFSEGREKRRV